jgi:HK97 family phage portal protein
MRGLFGALRQGLESKSIVASGDINKIWTELTGGVQSRSGPVVNVTTALRTSTILACARVLAEGVAQLPFKLYELGDDESKTPAIKHPAYKLLWRRPNDWMTSFDLRETMMFHAVLCEGGHAFINRVNGKVMELIPILPERIISRQLPDLSVVYRVQMGDGTVAEFDRADIFHVRGPSWNGVRGMQAISLAREAIGLAIATEETQAALNANGTRGGGILKVDTKLDDTKKEQLRKDFEAKYSGLQNSWRTVVTDVGAKYTPLELMTGIDAQYLETRKFQIEEICRMMRVFPQMVGHTDKTATFASAEQFFIAHVIHSLMPWVSRWEQSAERDILNNDGRYVAKLSVRALLRGDAKSQAEFYASGIINGWLTRNEARAFEELNPIDGLNQPLVPLNMGTQQDRQALVQQAAAAVKALGRLDDDAMLEAAVAGVIASYGQNRNVVVRA